MRRSNLSIFKCLISLDPYALWIPDMTHFSRFVAFFLLELFILRNKATKMDQSSIYKETNRPQFMTSSKMAHTLAARPVSCLNMKQHAKFYLQTKSGALSYIERFWCFIAIVYKIMILLEWQSRVLPG